MGHNYKLEFLGTLRAHTNEVTAIACPINNGDMIVSASRDMSIILWSLTNKDPCRLTGHSHFVLDVVISSTGQLALSGGGDGELCLWNLSTRTIDKRFVGHTMDVLSVAFCPDNSQFVSASRDKSIKLWNTSFCECVSAIKVGDAHGEWVSCVFSLNNLKPTFVSASGKSVTIRNSPEYVLRSTLAGHTDYVDTVAVSPEGSICASGGKDCKILFWDLSEGKQVYSLDVGHIIQLLCFSPTRFWLCAATKNGIFVWDLESRSYVNFFTVDLKAEAENDNLVKGSNHVEVVYCTSLSWSADGETLFSGYSDGVIRMYSTYIQ